MQPSSAHLAPRARQRLATVLAAVICQVSFAFNWCSITLFRNKIIFPLLTPKIGNCYGKLNVTCCLSYGLWTALPLMQFVASWLDNSLFLLYWVLFSAILLSIFLTPPTQSLCWHCIEMVPKQIALKWIAQKCCFDKDTGHWNRNQSCLVQTAERSRAGVWDWCSSPLVPRSNPFTVYLWERETFAEYKNNRVLWVVHLSANSTKTHCIGGIQWLRGHNFALFWPPPTSTWTFLTLNVDKNRDLLDHLPPLLVHIVIECPHTE